MNKDEIKDMLLYGRFSNLNPVNPFLIWADTNYELNKYYKRPDISINDDKRGIYLKNEMRHITGPAFMAKQY